MRTKIAAAALGASLLAGGGVGALLMAPTVATAADNSSSASSSTSSTAQQPDQWVQDTLGKLVDKGTITKAQATAVAQALEAARPAGGPGGRGGPGLDVAAKALGIDASTLQSDLQSGKTIAAVAKERNVDVQTVIAALVADMNSHLADAVSSGRLTQAEADDMKSHATERATALVNGERPAGAPDGGPGGPPPGASGSSSTGSSSSGSSTSTSTSGASTT
jgi:hypothetical protein